MIHDKSLENLQRNYSKWSTPDTKVIRVPKYLSEEVLDYAHKIDRNGNKETSENSTVTQSLIEIIKKIENKEKGYKVNSASALIKELKALI